MSATSPTLTDEVAPHRRVMIPLDGSQASEAAFDWYVANVRRDGDALVVAHVLEPPNLPTFSLKSGFGVPVDEWRDILLASGKRAKELEDQVAMRAVCNKIKIEYIAESSKKPGEALVDIAARTHSDMIVMSTNGMSDVRRAFVGSVSDYVLHHCQIPV